MLFLYHVATFLPNFSKYFCLRASISSSWCGSSFGSSGSDPASFTSGGVISSSSSCLITSSTTTHSSPSSFVNHRKSLILRISFLSMKYLLYLCAYTTPLDSRSSSYFSWLNTLFSIPNSDLMIPASLLYLNRFVYSSAFFVSQLAKYVSFWSRENSSCTFSLYAICHIGWKIKLYYLFVVTIFLFPLLPHTVLL